MRNIVFLFSFADAGKILSDINSTVNKIVWGEPFLLLLVGVGVFLSVRLRFFQAVRFPYWMRNTFLAIFKTPSVRSKDKKSRTISQFQALSTSLGGDCRNRKYNGGGGRDNRGRRGRRLLDVGRRFFRNDNEIFRKRSRNLLPSKKFRRGMVRGSDVLLKIRAGKKTIF